MPLVLHIFRKDAKHLWKEIGLTWLLLFWVTRLDWLRTGANPNSTEGWLNVLMPLAWIYLIGLSVLQDPVPGERQFWLTLPHGRATLLLEKAFFAAVFIHAPYLAANLTVLSARGFAPLTALPHLGEKQIFLLAVVTLPSLVVASLARNTMQFILFTLGAATAAMLADSGGAVSLGGGFNSVLPTHLLDEARKDLALLLLAVFSLGIVWLQYRSRRTGISRFAGIVGFLAVGVLQLWLLPQSTAPLDAALLGASRNTVAVRLAAGLPRTNLIDYSGSGLNIAVPYTLEGVTERDDVVYETLAANMILPSGRHLRAKVRSFGPGISASDIVFHLAPVSKNSGYMILKMRRETYSSLGPAPITLNGHLLLQYHRGGPTSTVAANTLIDLPDLGKCASSNLGGNAFQEDMLRLACESPDQLPYGEVGLVDTMSGRTWHTGLGAASTVVNYPRSTWLSPLNRKDAFFHLTADDALRPGNQWRAPLETASHHKFTVAPRPVIGRAVIDFELTGIRLSSYLLDSKPAR